MKKGGAGSSKPSARMRDVAARAGVGLTTVSRAFSEPDRVSRDTLRRIEAAVRDLNYRVNMSARSLRAAMTGRILVMLPHIGNPFFARVLKGIEEVAFASGRIILIGDTHRDSVLRQPYSTQSFTSQFAAGRVDGLILLDGSFPVTAELHSGTAYPLVAVSERAAGLAYVGIDNRAAAREAVGFLAKLGHRNIAHLAGPLGNVSAEERVAGFRQAMKSLGIDGDRALVERGDFSIMSGRAAAQRILNRYPRPTALFAANDEMAMGAIHEFKAAGLRIPDDMSIIGFDDLDAAEVFDPPLSSVRQPQREMGRTGMQILVDQLDGKLTGGDVILGHDLVVRASTCPILRGGRIARASRSEAP